MYLQNCCLPQRIIRSEQKNGEYQSKSVKMVLNVSDMLQSQKGEQDLTREKPRTR